MKALIPFSFRIDPDMKAEAEKLNIDLPEFFRRMLERACKEKKCPTCGQTVKAVKK